MSRSHRNACIVVALVAAALFIWAVSTLWLGYPRLSSEALDFNAMALIFLWGIGPAIWFAAVWRIWKSEVGLASAQQYARDFWIGAGAIVLILATSNLGKVPNVPPRQYEVAWKLIVEVIRITAWPILAALGLVMLRQPLSSFFDALGSRASKIGAFNVEIELSTLPEARAWLGPALDDLRKEYPATAGDSSGSLFRAIADATHADYVIVNLEGGEAWLTSRLFILATLIPRVRPIKRIVFLSDDDNFVGEAQPSAVAAAIAQRFPWLEEAYVAAHSIVNNNQLTLSTTLFGRLEPQIADMLLGNFLYGVRGNGSGDEWIDFGDYKERAEWINSTSLKRFLGRNLELGSVRRDPSMDALSLTKILLRHESAYVAIIDSAGRFAHLIDRHRALDQVVRRELN